MSRKQLEELRHNLQKSRLRVTPQRVEIFRILVNSKTHPDAETIYNKIKGVFSNISLATIYSTLRVFKKVGLIREISAYNGVRRYDADTSPHFHLICIGCNRIRDLEEKRFRRLKQSLARKTGYRLDSTALNICGYCPECIQKEVN
jgi:Fur family peroxide stress response transcriptional regulator